jgi:peptidoglycan glycosyltransferase
MPSRGLHQTQPIRGAIGADRREGLLLALAAAFVVTAAVALHLAYAPFDLRHLATVCSVCLVTSATAHLTLRRHLPGRDPLLLPTCALLSGWGLLMVGRVAPNFLPRQATWLMLGTIAMLVVIQVGRDLSWLRRYRYTWLVGGLALLAATLILGVNPSGSGPRLWLGLGGAYVQPSEPLKLLMVVFLASYLADRRRLIVSEGRKVGPVRLPPLAYVGPLLVMFGLAVLLLAAQQDLGAAMLFFLTFLSMLYLATEQWGYVAAGLVLFGGAGVVGYAVSSRLALRVDAWLDPWAGAADWSFQTVQSLLAFGAGGILGQGLGLGRTTYIPAVHTDFTFAAIGESFGLVGLLAVIALYGLLLLRGFRAAARAARAFERYLAAGLTAGLIIQAWVIMAANVKLAPIAGVTLPFLSYGGSSLLSTFIVLGLLLRISNRAGRSARPGWGSGSGSDRSTAGPLPMEPSVIGTSARASAVRSIYHTAGVLGIALVVLAACCGYWSVLRADWLVAREDNPRRVVYERSIVRGRILDRHGQVLAGATVGPSGLVTRTYPVPQAAPVVGYASLRYGTGGMEAAFDGTLRGEADRGALGGRWTELLHRAPQGRDVQLTLDADLQRRAQQALAGEAGAAVLLDAETGRVLAMASAPTFDPAQLAEQWETLREDASAPLINRATQGLYQPGAALQTVVVAEALREELIDDLEVGVGSELTEQILVDDVPLGCSLPPDGAPTLASAYASGCPAPIAALGERLAADGLAQAVDRWRLTVPPPLVIPTESSDWSRGVLSSPRDEAIGQGGLTVSPLHMALVAATVATDGTMPDPQLALRLQDADGGWRQPAADRGPHAVLSPAEARRLLSAWRRWDDGASADQGGVLGHWGVALAGEGAPHAWFLGAAPAGDDPRFALAVLVEHADEPRCAVVIGRQLLQAALEDAD